MNNFNDYVDGTAYITLLKSDFKDERRFNQYAAFMCLEGQNNITIPIDSERARNQFDYYDKMYGGYKNSYLEAFLKVTKMERENDRN